MRFAFPSSSSSSLRSLSESSSTISSLVVVKVAKIGQRKKTRSKFERGNFNALSSSSSSFSTQTTTTRVCARTAKRRNGSIGRKRRRQKPKGFFSSCAALNAFSATNDDDDDDDDDDAPFAYPSRCDVIPAFIGGLNPVNSVLFYFTGAVMTQGTIQTTAQWTVFVVFPVLFLMYLVRKWRYEGREERRMAKAAADADADADDGNDNDRNNDSNNSSSDSSTKSANTTSMSYVRSMRGRWLDVHVCYAFLLPAGISAGEHSSYWLVLAPAFMLYRFLFSEDDRSAERQNGAAKTGMFSRFSAISSFLSPAGRGLSAFVLIARRVHKYTKIVFASLALALLIVSGSATLHQSLTALNGGGMALRVLLSPFAIGVAFLGYFAPAALLPRYISNVFSRKITADEVNAPKAPLSEDERIKLEIKKESEKKNRKWWLLIGFIAMGMSAFTGSDLPIVIAFAAQLCKANPDALLTAMAEKGGMVEFETKIADAFDRVVLSKKERGEITSDDSTIENDAKKQA